MVEKINKSVVGIAVCMAFIVITPIVVYSISSELTQKPACEFGNLPGVFVSLIDKGNPTIKFFETEHCLTETRETFMRKVQEFGHE